MSAQSCQHGWPPDSCGLCAAAEETEHDMTSDQPRTEEEETVEKAARAFWQAFVQPRLTQAAEVWERVWERDKPGYLRGAQAAWDAVSDDHRAVVDEESTCPDRECGHLISAHDIVGCAIAGCRGKCNYIAWDGKLMSREPVYCYGKVHVLYGTGAGCQCGELVRR